MIHIGNRFVKILFPRLFCNDVEGRLMRLERNGLVRRAKYKPVLHSMLDVKQLPTLEKNSSLLEAVLAERAENR